MSRELILPAIFTVMVIGMTIFPDRAELFGPDEDAASGEVAVLASGSQG